MLAYRSMEPQSASNAIVPRVPILNLAYNRQLRLLRGTQGQSELERVMEADYVLDYNVIAAARANHLYLLARIKAGPPVGSQQRRPLNIGVVLDRSGSMSGEKLDYVKKAAQFLVQHLGASDRFSLTTYDNVVEVPVNPEPPIYKDTINRAINAITARGTTNLSGGWLQGCQLVQQAITDGQVNRVILLTDGLANQGITEPPRLTALARQKREEGVTTTCMGVGMDFNEDLLTAMASEGGGAFYFIDNPDQAPQIFAEELSDLLNVVGQNLIITLILAGELRMVRQLNSYPVETRDGKIVFRLGDIFADEVKSLVLELHIPALATLGPVEVARLRFEYDELAETSVMHRTLELPIMVNAVPESEAAAQPPNPEAVKPVLLLRAARAREEAVQHADQGDFSRAKEILNNIADEMQTAGLSDKELEAEHNMLREEAVDMDLGSQRYDQHARKTSQTKSFYTSRQGRMYQQKVGSHQRMKQSRSALERSGDAPRVIAWQGNTRDLDMDCLHIGREANNDIVIAEEEVSAHHCQIARAGDDLFLEDLNSLNGTYANGGRVTDRFRLSVGDVMTVGSVLFQFLEEAPGV